MVSCRSPEWSPSWIFLRAGHELPLGGIDVPPLQWCAPRDVQPLHSHRSVRRFLYEHHAETLRRPARLLWLVPGLRPPRPGVGPRPQRLLHHGRPLRAARVRSRRLRSDAQHLRGPSAGRAGRLAMRIGHRGELDGRCNDLGGAARQRLGCWSRGDTGGHGLGGDGRRLGKMADQETNNQQPGKQAQRTQGHRST